MYNINRPFIADIYPNPAINRALDGISKTAAERKEALVTKLQSKIDQLRQLCLKEKVLSFLSVLQPIF